jgi:hypothetical protein
VGELLSSVRDPANSDKTLLETIKEETAGRYALGRPSTRFIVPTAHGPERVSPKSMPISLQHRLALINIIFTSEKTPERRRICDHLDEKFFKTGFWLLWSTT